MSLRLLSAQKMSQKKFGTLIADPYFSNVSLLLHMNGTNGSTIFTDVKSHVMTAVGNAQISTAQSVFGGASGLFDGTGDVVTTPITGVADFGTGEFCIESRIRLASTAAVMCLCSVYSGSGIAIQVNSPSAGYIRVYNYTTSILSYNAGLTTNTWYTIRVSRVSGVLRIFAGGVAVASVADTSSYGGTTFGIGAEPGGGASFNGYIDEFRVTKVVGRGADNYTVDVVPFPDL